MFLKPNFHSLEEYQSYLQDQITDRYKLLAALKKGASADDPNLIHRTKYATIVIREQLKLVNHALENFH